MQFLLLATEPSTLQYATGGLLTLGAYLLVTRGRGLRQKVRRESPPSLPESPVVAPPGEQRRAA